ncbi:MAG TPA: PilN domain-containing protein [Myxococcales bacterium]|nr:PilN domain-containing protein [Myxococcales bacterium]
MIRINLLPVRAVKKREMGRQVLVLGAGVLAITLVLNTVWYLGRNSTYSQNQERITATRARIAELEKVIGEVNNINKRKREVEEKLKVLDELRKGRSGPVRMLDALSTATPKKVWLKDFDEKANAVKLEGTAVSHDDVAEFMRALQNVVWTPKGMARLVEQKRDAKTSRVELLAAEGAIEEFPVGQIAQFFTSIDLKKAEQTTTTGTPASGGGAKLVRFTITLTANYAI